MKTTQFFTEESLKRSAELSTEEIIKFVENFRKLYSINQKTSKSVLISIKIPEDLLSAFKSLAKLQGKKYQTKIKELMVQDVKQSGKI